MKVDALFRATEDFDLPGGQKGMVRALSDSERTHRQRYALLKSLEVERELRDETSDAYKLDIAPLARTESPEALIALVLETKRLGLRREALALYPDRYIPFPEDASDIEEREVLEQRRETEAQIHKRRNDLVEKRLAEIHQKWEDQPIEALRQAAMTSCVDVYAREELFRAAEIYTVWAGTFVYEDQENSTNPKRLFKSPESVSEVPTDAIQHLLVKVSAIDSVDVWELQKNSLTGSGMASSA